MPTERIPYVITLRVQRISFLTNHVPTNHVQQRRWQYITSTKVRYEYGLASVYFDFHYLEDYKQTKRNDKPFGLILLDVTIM